MSKRVAQLVDRFVMAHNDGAVQREWELYERLCGMADGWDATDKEADDARRALDSLGREGFLQDY